MNINIIINDYRRDNFYILLYLFFAHCYKSDASFSLFVTILLNVNTHDSEAKLG